MGDAAGDFIEGGEDGDLVLDGLGVESLTRQRHGACRNRRQKRPADEPPPIHGDPFASHHAAHLMPPCPSPVAPGCAPLASNASSIIGATVWHRRPTPPPPLVLAIALGAEPEPDMIGGPAPLDIAQGRPQELQSLVQDHGALGLLELVEKGTAKGPEPPFHARLE